MMKDVPGYNGKYQINECGNIINKNGHVMRSAASKNGYLRVALELPDSTKRKNELVHRLVAKTFIPNPDNLPIVMHLDNDTYNNHISNLRWGSQSDNMQQAFSEGRKVSPMKDKHIMCRYASKYIIYNKKTGDEVICKHLSDVAESVCYAEVSLKNVINNSNERTLAQGPYAGYAIKRIPLVGELNKNQFTKK